MSQNLRNQNNKNQKPYGLIDAPSASEFFSLLGELEKEEEDNKEPEPGFFYEEDTILDYLKNSQSQDYINLSHQLNNSESYSDFCRIINEMKELVDKEISQAKKEPPLYYCCSTCQELECMCHQLFAKCPMTHCTNQYSIYDAEKCEDCLRSEVTICYCGNQFPTNQPYGMCADCEILDRQQESIDQIRYPDDVDRYISDSD